MKGADIKRILNTRGFTQQEVADRLGKTLANLNGQLGKDDIRTGLIEDISRVTGIPMADFFQGPVGAIDFSPKPVEPEAQEILDRWKGERHLLRCFDRYKEPHDYNRRMREALKKMKRPDGTFIEKDCSSTGPATPGPPCARSWTSPIQPSASAWGTG